jgi:hypothetical protein
MLNEVPSVEYGNANMREYGSGKMRGREGEVVRRNLGDLVDKQLTGDFPRGGSRCSDATSGLLPCTGREDCGTIVKLHAYLLRKQ